MINQTPPAWAFKSAKEIETDTIRAYELSKRIAAHAPDAEALENIISDVLNAWDKWRSQADFKHGNHCGGSPCICGRNELLDHIAEARAHVSTEQVLGNK